MADSFLYLTWPILLFSILGYLYEGMYRSRRLSSLFFLISSSGVLLFSLTHVSLCSDYSSYKQIYDASRNIPLSLHSLVGLDGSYRMFASVWSLLSKGLSLDSYTSYHFFTAFYQASSIFILVLLIYSFFPRWKNTLLFLVLFGSLQFYHVILCAIRQGLSASFLAVFLMILMPEAKMRGKIKKFIIVFLMFYLAIFSHWQSLILILLILLFFLPSLKLPKSRLISKVIKSRVILLIAAFALFIVAYFYAVEIASQLIRPLASIVLSGQSNAIEIYTDFGNQGSYGTRFFWTSYIDLIFIYLSLSRRKSLNKLLHSKFGNSLPDSRNQISFLNLIVYFSLINLVLKSLMLSGLGVLIRLSISIHLLQILCIPSLLDRMRKPMSIAFIALISLPSVLFIFLVSNSGFLNILNF